MNDTTRIILVISLGLLALIFGWLAVVVLPPRIETAMFNACFSENPQWGSDTCSRISQQKIWLGMEDDMALLSWGPPSDINKSVGSWGVREQWVYGWTSNVSYLYFENGILTSWQR